MSWVTFIWALVIGACATMALPHLFVGIKERAWANLFFVVAALSVAGIAFGELAIMHSRTVEEIGRAIQWTNVALFFMFLGVVGFVHSYFGTGRLWLALTICGGRLVILVINFVSPPNATFHEITALRRFDFLGETVSMPQGVIGPTVRFAHLMGFLLIAFVIDASITLWRRRSAEGRRRAAVVGPSIVLFVVLASVVVVLTNASRVQLPYLISFPFLGVIMAMGFELSYDIIRAAQIAHELRISEGALRESEERMSLATESANLGLWLWGLTA